MRLPIPVEKRVAIALWYLATGDTYRDVAHQFSLGVATAREIIREVCLAMEAELYWTVVCLGDRVGEIMDGFGHLGFPHCIGAVDGCHIPIRAPGRRYDEYGNRKGFCSVILQGTVDHTGRFIDAEAGWGGQRNDAFVFQQSNLRTAIEAGAYVPGYPTVTMQGAGVPALIVADGAYPQRRWLMKPYAPPRNAVEAYFNGRLCRARNIVERAFGHLKVRWRCLLSCLQVNITPVILVCVILHNICEAHGHEPLEMLPRENIEVKEEGLPTGGVWKRRRSSRSSSHCSSSRFLTVVRSAMRRRRLRSRFRRSSEESAPSYGPVPPARRFLPVPKS
ncbi:uncharacterized protein LOC143819677 [Paroedura picta]|uniref:uncharacterized protein LOC143819677 n=1 Tax=Paroedura picta TaxID=143630 RepID=UPI00405686B5